MRFNLFGRKKKHNIYHDIQGLVSYQQIHMLLEKSKNLAKLDRHKESVEVLKSAERIAVDLVNENPDSLEDNLILAFFYKDAGIQDRAAIIFKKILNSEIFELDKLARVELSGELQKLNREKPMSQKHSIPPAKQLFTQIYLCLNCGRLINYITMPCPHCQWHPSEEKDLAREIILSNASIKVPSLLLISRGIDIGRSPSEMVPDLESRINKFISLGEEKTGIKHMLNVLRKNSGGELKSIEQFRECPNCGHRVLLSNDEECGECGYSLDLPDSLRLLICLDNILWLCEKRVEPDNTKEFAELISLLVFMENNLLEKQEAPTHQERKYALSLLMKMGTISDKNRGAVVYTNNLKDIKIYLVKDDMLEDTERFGLFLHAEIEYFVEKMIAGVSL